jgi:hypothetical protein
VRLTSLQMADRCGVRNGKTSNALAEIPSSFISSSSPSFKLLYSIHSTRACVFHSLQEPSALSDSSFFCLNARVNVTTYLPWRGHGPVSCLAIDLTIEEEQSSIPLLLVHSDIPTVITSLNRLHKNPGSPQFSMVCRFDLSGPTGLHS